MKLPQRPITVEGGVDMALTVPLLWGFPQRPHRDRETDLSPPSRYHRELYYEAFRRGLTVRSNWLWLRRGLVAHHHHLEQLQSRRLWLWWIAGVGVAAPMVGLAAAVPMAGLAAAAAADAVAAAAVGSGFIPMDLSRVHKAVGSGRTPTAATARLMRVLQKVSTDLSAAAAGNSTDSRREHHRARAARRAQEHAAVASHRGASRRLLS
jgi:hypothetical protein